MAFGAPFVSVPAVVPGEFDEDQPVQGYCKACKSVQTLYLGDSLNFGNIVAECDGCGTEFDYTPIDHKGILREARRGF